MAQLGNLIVNGVTRLLSKLYVSDSVTAPTFIGKLTGNADSATKLSSSAGNATQPVYFSDGKPVATTYTLGKSVPADAKFTDTNTWRGVQNNLTSTATDQSLSAAQGKALKDLVDGKAAASHTHTKSQITDFPTLGDASSKTVRTLSSQGSSGWSNKDTDDKYVPTMSFIAYWNGSYGGSASNLAYCNKGAFGTAATKNTGDFAEASHAHSAFGKATADAAGSAGFVPAPAKGQQGLYLRGDGSWATPTNTTYGVASTSANGLMSSGDKSKLDGIATGANNYTHPTTSGNKHIPSGGSSGQILRWSADGTAVWGNDNNTTYSAFKGATSSAAGGAGLVPAPGTANAGQYLRGDGTWATPTNTTYSAASQSAAGLMSADDKKKLDGIATGANAYSHPTGNGNNHIPAGGSAGQILRWSAAGTAVWGSDNNTTYSAFKGATSSAAGGSGLVPAPGTTNAGQYLRGDGTWATPTNTTYSNMTAATATADGKAGLVPAPGAGKQGQYLRGDGTWATPTNTTYGAASQSASGLMSADDKKKLDGVATGANAYSLPTATGSVLGGVKTGSNITNSSGTISLTKANVTNALGYTPPTSATVVKIVKWG